MNRSVAKDGPPPLLSAVIVNYNSWPEAKRLAAALAQSSGPDPGRLEVLVVDNASAAPPPDDLASYRPTVRALLSPTNGGFAAGVNLGWRATSAPWLLVLNPDVEPPEDFLPKLFARLEIGPDPWGPKVGIVGFGLREPDGTRQLSVGPFPSLGRVLVEAFLPRPRRKYWRESAVRPGEVPWVTGACLLLRRATLEDVGGLDEDFFLYHEEVALCRSAWDKGWRVAYDPSLEVVHANPLQNRRPTPLLWSLTRHGKLLYFLKHLPRWQFLALAHVVEWDARGRAALTRGPESKGWSGIARMARRMRGPIGSVPKGTEALALAKGLDESPPLIVKGRRTDGPSQAPPPPRSDALGPDGLGDLGPRRPGGQLRDLRP